MILADKIINERKKNGWSQEELAEKLNVSRQSISKWEGAQAVPDLQRILKMAEIFNVSTDYLLKDEIEPEENVSARNLAEETEDEPPLIKVSMEEANAFMNYKKWSLPKVGIGVGLCITCPVVLIFLVGLNESNFITEKMAVIIGLAFLFLQIAAGVITFVKVDEKGKRFNYISTKDIDTEYGVTGLVKELKEKYAPKYTTGTIVGVCLCLLCSLPLIVTALAGVSNFITTCMVCVLLIFIAVGVYIFIVTGGTKSTYEMLLQERDYSHKGKINTKKLQPFNSIYWGAVVAGFLAYSFLSNRWDRSWIIFAVAGVVFPVYHAFVKVALKIETEE